MYSLFPDLFDYALIVPLLLRIVSGAYFILLGYLLIRAVRASAETTLVRAALGLFAALQLGVGVLLFAGAGTQVAALAGIILALVSYTTHIGTFAHDAGRHLHVLLLTNCIALLFLGPGLLALDLPL